MLNQNEKPENIPKFSEERTRSGSQIHSNTNAAINFYIKLIQTLWFQIVLLLLAFATLIVVSVARWNTNTARCGHGQSLGTYLVVALFAYLIILALTMLAQWINRIRMPERAVTVLGFTNLICFLMGTFGASVTHGSYPCSDLHNLQGVWAYTIWVSVSFYLCFLYCLSATIMVHAPLMDPDNEGVWPLVYLRCLCWSIGVRKGLVLIPFGVLVLINVVAIVQTRDSSCSNELKIFLYLALVVHLILLGLGIWVLYFVIVRSRLILYIILGCSLFGFACAVMSTIWTKYALECSSNESGTTLYKSAVTIQVLLYTASATLFLLSTCCKLESCLQLVDRDNFFQVESRKHLSINKQ